MRPCARGGRASPCGRGPHGQRGPNHDHNHDHKNWVACNKQWSWPWLGRGQSSSSVTSLCVTGNPVPFVVVVVIVVVHGRDGHGLTNISLFTNARYSFCKKLPRLD